MADVIVRLLEVVMQLLEICGATVLILGFVVATWKWAQHVRREGHRAALAGAGRVVSGRRLA